MLVVIMAALSVVCMAQSSSGPNVDAQRAAMAKLAFLAGKWSGEANVLRGPGQTIALVQTEEARYRLGDLVLEIEGVGRAKADGKLVLQALGLVSYDDQTKTYKMRAFNDGRWLDTELKLGDDSRSISWAFSFGEISTISVLRVNEKDEWTESAELLMPGKPRQKLMDVSVRRESAK
jgi:hypothetical protein